MLRWKRVVVGTDFSGTAEAAVRTGEWLARESGGTLVLVHAVEPLPHSLLPLMEDAPGHEELWAEEPRRRMARLLSRLREDGLRVEGMVRRGVPWRETLAVVEEVGADGVCLGNSGHSAVERMLLGATAENVVRNSPVPVLVTRDRPLGKVDRVLVPIDLQEGSRRAAEYAVREFPERVRLEGLMVVEVQPWLDPGTAPWLPDAEGFEERVRAFLAEAGAERIEPRVVMFADPAATILEDARTRDADLIVLATHGRHGLARALMGSVAEKVVRHADRPVLVLPGPREEAEEKGSGE